MMGPGMMQGMMMGIMSIRIDQQVIKAQKAELDVTNWSRSLVHEVLIVPQSEAQFDAVRSLLPGREEKVLRGGKVFSAGTYLSPRYAELVCEKYIALGLFATQVAVSPNSTSSEVQPAEKAAAT